MKNREKSIIEKCTITNTVPILHIVSILSIILILIAGFFLSNNLSKVKKELENCKSSKSSCKSF